MFPGTSIYCNIFLVPAFVQRFCFWKNLVSFFKLEHKIVDLKNYLLLGVPVAFHEGANGCKIKVIIHHLLNTEDDLEEIILDDCVATTVDDDVSGDN